MRRVLALAVGLLAVIGRCAPALAQVAPLTSSVSSLTASSGGSGSGDIDSVAVTTSSPLTGTASCTTGACSFTLGLGTVPVAKGGTGLTAGTDGGILGYTAAGTLASSVALTAGALVLGGGAGATPTPLGSLGTTTTVLHGNAAGAPTWASVSLTADVSGILPGANGGTGNGFFAVSGPATSLKTFTLPNASAAILTDNAAVTVAQGGSGIATTTAYSLVMSGTTATGTWNATIGPGTATQVLTSNGAGAYPTWQAASGGISGLTSTKIPVAASSTTIADSGLTWASSVLTVAGAITVTSQAAGTIGAVIKGAASQTANLQEWQNSSGTVLASISAAGVPSFPGAGTSSLRIGPSSVASGNGDVAIGNTASASSGSATALGTASTAIDRALAAGYQSSATGAVSVVLGYQATDSGGASATVVGGGATGVANATAIGRLANAASLSVAIGILSVAPGANQFVAGSSAANTAWIDNVYFGSGVTDTAPKSVTYNATGGSGSNVAGADISIAGGKGTGTGISGKVKLQVAPHGSTGSSANALVDAISLTDAFLTDPSTSSDTCTAQELRISATYIYVCTATNTWKRVALSAF